MSKQLLVVYHSRTGGTRQLVQSLQDGARDGGASTTLRLLPAHEAQVDDLLAADGYLFAIGHWGRPSNLDDREPWFAPRTEVDERVQKAMDRFTVVAFWADPSHARDDETDVAYWDDLIDSWHRRYKDRLLLWADGAYRAFALSVAP